MALAVRPVAGTVDPASFRDPSGFVFRTDTTLLRQVNQSYAEAYERLNDSGLYAALVADGLLIPHEVLPVDQYARTAEAYRILQPERVRFVSYPYEWCFSQLKDAALATLEIQNRALARGLTLKDASAYNIQFHEGPAILIDTLSFDLYEEGAPWIAYRQFCQHFLAPLLLMSYTDVRLSGLLARHLDGVPLDLASRLLPWRTRLRPGALLHVHLHARSLARHAAHGARPRRGRVSPSGMLGIVDSLRTTVSALDWRPHSSDGSATRAATATPSGRLGRSGAPSRNSWVESACRRARRSGTWVRTPGIKVALRRSCPSTSSLSMPIRPPSSRTTVAARPTSKRTSYHSFRI